MFEMPLFFAQGEGSRSSDTGRLYFKDRWWTVRWSVFGNRAMFGSQLSQGQEIGIKLYFPDSKDREYLRDQRIIFPDRIVMDFDGTRITSWKGYLGKPGDDGFVSFGREQPPVLRMYESLFAFLREHL